MDKIPLILGNILIKQPPSAKSGAHPKASAARFNILRWADYRRIIRTTRAKVESGNTVTNATETPASATATAVEAIFFIDVDSLLVTAWPRHSPD
jgi:hypothetical protein